MQEKYKLRESQEKKEARLAAIELLHQTANEWAIDLAVTKGADEQEMRSVC